MYSSADYLYQKQRREDERAEAAERIRQAQLLGEAQRGPGAFSRFARAVASLFSRKPRREAEPQPKPRGRFAG